MLSTDWIEARASDALASSFLVLLAEHPLERGNLADV
jgi:hypothetical protein